ncbi:Hypothetical protein A7982_06416 [Minicystis rosea]|nr:Hypothetical protein A7982_06416 [Minicystis rosea]
MNRRVGPALATALAALSLASIARAGPPDRVTFQAGRVEADAALGDVTLERGVELRYDRYRLRSERLRVRLEGNAVSFDGTARLALCPCPDPPLVLAVSGGRFAPPGDLFLRFPRVELKGIPIFALPWIWLRAPDQPGLLPPIIALRARDGLLLGSGVHLPWRGSDGAVRALDLSAAGFTSGGVELSASLRTPDTRAQAIVDLVHGTRVAIDARGALPEKNGPAAVAWTLDALRGDRALSATMDLAAAARPFDTGAAEVSLRAGGRSIAAIAAGGVAARAERGEGPIAAGPIARLALGGPIGRVGSWSADAAGVVLANAEPAGGLPLARASAAAEIDLRPGPFELRMSAAARARYAGSLDAIDTGPSRELAAATRAELSLPFVRTFPGASGQASLSHWIIPVIAVRGALADQRGSFFAPIDGVVPHASWIAAAGITTAVGRYAGSALRLDLRGGATGDAATRAQPLLHARLGMDARIAAIAVEGAWVGGSIPADMENGRTTADLQNGYSATDPQNGSVAAAGDQNGNAAASADLRASGHALLVRARLGAEDGVTLRVDAAAQGGAGAGQARAIAAGAWAALPGMRSRTWPSMGSRSAASSRCPGPRASARRHAQTRIWLRGRCSRCAARPSTGTRAGVSGSASSRANVWVARVSTSRSPSTWCRGSRAERRRALREERARRPVKRVTG